MIKLRADEKKFLGKVFQAEIENRLPFQSKAEIFKRMEVAELVMYHELKLPGRFTVTVSGWFLTHKGRIAYCESCGRCR